MKPLHVIAADVARTRHRLVLRYGVAVISVVLALFFSLGFQALTENAPFMLFWLPVTLSAWFGGFGPGLLAILLTVVSIDYFLMAPHHSLNISDEEAAQLVLFSIGAILVSLVFEARHRSEQELRLSKGQLDIILRGISDGITAQTPDGHLIYANEAAARIIGLADSKTLMATPAAEILSHFEIFDENNQPLAAEHLPSRQTLAGRVVPEKIVRFRNQLGAERWSALRSTPVVDENGQVLFAINVFQDITALKRVEQANHERREWLRVTLMGIADSVITTDTEGRVTLLNPKAAEMTGWNAEDALGQPIDQVLRLIDEATREPIENPVLRALREGRAVELENHTSMLTPDGQEKVVDDSGAPIRNAEGEIIGAVVVFRDVTARRQAEIQLRESEERFRILADSTPVLIWMADITKQYTYFNKAWLEFTGRTVEQELGDGWAESIHPDDVAHCMEIYARCFEDRQPFQRDYRLKRADGDYRWILDHGIPRFDAKGVFLGYIGSCTDITERKKAEEDRRYIASIVENSEDAIFGKSLEGIIQSWNAGAELMYGYSADEILGTSVVRLFPRGHEDELNLIMSQLKNGIPIKHYEAKRVRKDGTPLDVSIKITPIRDGNGTVIGAATIARDITELKRVQMLEHEQRVLAESLRDTATALNSTLNLSEVLDRILVNIGRVVPHDAAEILLIENGVARVVRSRGYQTASEQVQFPIDQTSNLHYMANTRQPILLADIQSSAEWVETSISREQRWRSYVGTPIYRKKEMIGFINLISTKLNFFSKVHADRLQAFAEQAAIALQNARLYAKEQELAALQERERLSRELHDAVSQTLFSASMMAEALARQYKTQPQKVEARLLELHQLTRGALAEMRMLLLELRPAALVSVEFSELMQQLAESVQSRKRIKIKVEVPAHFDLPEDIKLAAYRIIQEALNNITKHAQASQVQVIITPQEQGVELLVRDNGRGFDPGTVGSTSFGLNIMQERAKQIGANLQVKSEIGNGTEVIIFWPFQSEETPTT
ncbi:MAG TPA: PAS domain S-box protein [Aggregatilineaceae bacterium]|nr:PAS domain S-box protein [Aggregatilineaceae bacterium]